MTQESRYAVYVSQLHTVSSRQLVCKYLYGITQNTTDTWATENHVTAIAKNKKLKHISINIYTRVILPIFKIIIFLNSTF